ncbi:hypothetical protein Tco_1063494 [Tanacetum coccineum]
MSQPANDDFSQHLSDGEESNHEDASDTGTAPKQQQQQQVIPQTTAISNIKLPILKKEEYDIWAMEMEHYLEYIDNEVWKVIQNGNSKKRISTGKDGVVRVLSPVTAAEIQAVEKERKAKNILLMVIPKEHMRRFHGMDDAKEIWEAIRTRFVGNANSKKMQKEAYKISNSEGLEKGYDRFQQLLSQLEAHGAEVSTEDANHKFLRSLPSAWSNLAMTMRTNPEIDNLSINDLYNNLRVFEQEIQGLFKDVITKTIDYCLLDVVVEFYREMIASQLQGKLWLYDEVQIFKLVEHMKIKMKISEDLLIKIKIQKILEDILKCFKDIVCSYLLIDKVLKLKKFKKDALVKLFKIIKSRKIDDVDIEEMDINWQMAMIAIRMKKECTAKGVHDGKKKRREFLFINLRSWEEARHEKNQMGVLGQLDDGIVNWA